MVRLDLGYMIVFSVIEIISFIIFFLFQNLCNSGDLFPLILHKNSNVRSYASIKKWVLRD